MSVSQRHENDLELSQHRESFLISQILEGNSQLFYDLIRPFERTIYKVAFSILQNTADAEEVSQEAVLKAFLHLSQMRVRFKAWLVQIVINEARQRRRKDKSHLYVELEIPENEEPLDAFDVRSFADWRDLPIDTVLQSELRVAVRDAINSLPAGYRLPLHLVDVEGLSYNEAAEVLEMSAPAVKTRVHRARLRIQEHLRPYFRPRASDWLTKLKGMNPWSRAGK